MRGENVQKYGNEESENQPSFMCKVALFYM